MNRNAVLARAIEEQIAYLQSVLLRLQDENPPAYNRDDENQGHDFMMFAMSDPGFQAYLLRRELGVDR